MSAPSSPRAGLSPTDLLHEAIEHARHLLPAQGPIGNFIHHNTLHAFQHLSFHEAVAAACDVNDAEGYLSEARYRESWREGRIEDRDVEHALALRGRQVPDETIGPLQLRELEMLVLRHGLERESPSGLRWRMAEDAVTSRLRDDLPPAIRTRLIERSIAWASGLDGDLAKQVDKLLGPLSSLELVRSLVTSDPEAAATMALWAASRSVAPVRPDPDRTRLLDRTGVDRTHRDLLVALGAPDPAELANAELIRMLGAYFDEGMARWALPGRERGLLACFREYLGLAPQMLPAWQRRVRKRLTAAMKEGKDASALSISILEELGVAPEHWDTYIPRLLLQLPGWSGMVARLESVPEDRAPDSAPASLAELVALRLVLDVEALAASARAIDHRGSMTQLVDTARRIWARDERRRAHDAPYRLFLLAQLAGISASELHALGKTVADQLVTALDAFDSISRRRVLHEAYEHHHLREVLGALADNMARPADAESEEPRFQVAFCIDDREEGIRRHFEELGRDHHTLSVAGFFGVAMQYRSLDDPSPTSLCPIVVKPAHRIEERAIADHADASERRRKMRAAGGWIRHEVADASRSFVRGAALTPLLGLLSVVPLAARVLFPKRAHDIAEGTTNYFLPAPRTELSLHREVNGHDEVVSLARGFTLEERVERVAGTLENLGLTRRFGRLVAFLGHGASTVNNPHHSAYDCGACGGRNGGPNARAFASMANDPEVRAGLRARGIDVPDTTWFLGGLHDTTTDAITLFELESVPASHAPDLVELRQDLDRARTMSAHERCRKFEHAPDDADPEQALDHVEERAVDLSQARPELGHVTNAACIVGRRAITRGLFLDRRALLVSYDPSIDDAPAKILERILGAVVPVGAGINLEYYFSTVDPERWGCGTKLPHNLSGLLGVMEGTSGDLRTGLPRQMIEIHEPLRLLCVVEATPETILGIASRKPEVAELVNKGWVRLACIDPSTHAISVLGPDGFVALEREERTLEVFHRASDWYAGKRGFLAPVRIEREGVQAA